LSGKPTRTSATNREMMTFLAVACQPVSISEFNSLLAVAAVAEAFPRLAKLPPAQRQRQLEAATEAAAGQAASEREALARDFLSQPENYAIAGEFTQCLSPADITQAGPAALRRDLRNAFYSRQEERLQLLYEDYYRLLPPEHPDDDAFSFLDAGMNRDWLMQLPPLLLSICAWDYQTYLMNRLRSSQTLEEVVLARRYEVYQSAILPLIDQMVLQGRLAEAENLLALCDGDAADLRAAWIAFEHGEYPRARMLFTNALYAIRLRSGAKGYYFRTVGGLYYIFTLLREKTEISLSLAAKNTALATLHPTWTAISRHLSILVFRLRRQPLPDPPANPSQIAAAALPLQQFFHALISYWLQDCPAPTLREQLRRVTIMAENGAYDAVAEACREMARRLASGTPAANVGQHTLIDCVAVCHPWLDTLAELQEILATSTKDTDNRLVWHLQPGEDGQVVPVPMEQRLGKSGKWGKARPFRTRAAVPDWPEHITAQDMLALAILENRLDGKAFSPDSAARAIKALTGHANLFWDDGTGTAPTPTAIVPAQPWCQLLDGGEGGVTVTMRPLLTPGHGLTARHEPDNTIALYSFSQQAQAVAAHLGHGVTLPPTALTAAKAVLLELSQQFAMLSDIALDFLGVVGASAPSQPVFRLTPSERGLVIDLVLRPFAGHPHPFPPGQGPREFLQPTPGGIVRTVRNPALEEQTAETVVNACPALAGHDSGTWQWRLPEPETCYEFLLQVQALGENCQVEWPQSAPIRMTRPISFSDVQLQTRRQGDWFSVTGEVQVNEQLTVTFQELLRSARDNGNSRFLQLDDGQIVCLTDSFRRRLQEIAAISDLRDQDARFHLFTLPLTDRLLSEAGDLRHAPEWLERLQAIDRAQNLQPEIPSGLRATLRAYQYDGYAWMSRIDAWGAGACLADDMGLGKTIQAIALILAKTAEGPALVIAPTSVCANWRLEIERFAPSLEVVLFGPGDRQEVLANMGPGKVMISSYGLLQSEEKTVAEIHWRVAVLDEAQAIKNFNAKRSQAALKLDADFRLATTGTPIENNLDELWSIFHFINPGLLGSRRHFQRRFATPIEREGSQAASSQLNALISPFLLRRTKAQVLRELPAKTEISLLVELSEEERAFYEALRRDLVSELSALRRQNPAQLRFHVLGAIMKLRLAVCNPQLVRAESTLDSSKQKAFAELLDELLKNGHKVLVFSQFVRHLELIRPILEERRVSYHYLDGSTPAKERAEAVAAFQRGERDVFLISLRAGGLGLNLTAANYVIHLDPWWNPAVENQASDRAHRLGQTKPVTIYRLVSQNTIETKILDLHQKKRRLAEQLLADHDAPSAVSADELLKLISEP